MAGLPAGADEDALAARVRDGVDLTQRLSGGPVVALARVEDAGLKFRLHLLEIYRGPEDLPDPLRVAYRSDNVARRPEDPPFAAVPGEEAVFVLERWTDYYGELGDEDLFRPSLGYRSRIPLPAEGRQALLDAVEALIAYEDSEQRAEAEAELRSWLDEPNPWLIDAALYHASQVGPPGRDWLDSLVRFSAHTNPRRRTMALEALGIGLSRGRFEDSRSSFARNPALAGTLATEGGEAARRARQALVRAARSDESAQVRRTAVEAMGRSGLEDLGPILEVIAEQDEDQDVRYEAAVLLHRLRTAEDDSRR